jgi:hypothetical protein
MQGTFHFYYKYYAKYLKYLQKYFNEKYIDTKFFFWTFVDKFKLNNIILAIDCYQWYTKQQLIEEFYMKSYCMDILHNGDINCR